MRRNIIRKKQKQKAKKKEEVDQGNAGGKKREGQRVNEEKGNEGKGKDELPIGK